MLKRFLEQLSADLGLPSPLVNKEEGGYSITFAPKIHVKFTENEERVIKLYAVLTEIPAKDQEDFFFRLATANLYGSETGGNALGLDPETKHVVLMRLVTPEESFGEFRSALEEFLNYAEIWKLETKAFA